MARAEDTEVIDKFEGFYRDYYRNEIGQLAQKYPNEKRSLYVDWDDLYRFDPDLADDFIAQPEQMSDYAEEALRLYDLPVDVKLGQAHVRVKNLQTTTGIRDIRARHRGQLVEVTGIIRKATDVRPKVTEAAFECQRCGTLTRIPQTSGEFYEPHECQGCERQGPFEINFDQSEFVDAQKLRVQESPEGLRGGETPQSIDVHIDDDITGRVTAGDHVRVTGVLHLDQQGSNQEKSPIFDVYMDGMSVEIEDEQFEDMDITDEDKKRIIELSNESDIYEKMIASMAPSIYGYDQEKLAIIMQLFSGVTKHLPDGSRTRGDLHMLLIGDPGTGKCVKSSTKVTLADGSEVPIGDLVESKLKNPTQVEDGVYEEVGFDVPSMTKDGTLTSRQATKVWKREAPDRMYRIRTASGRELEVTPTHPLFVSSDGGIQANKTADLEEGDFVATPRLIPAEGDDTLDLSYRRSQANNAVRVNEPDELTPAIARLIGYIIAEGYVEHRNDNTGGVWITNNDQEILDDAASALDRLGVTHFERKPHPEKTASELVCSSGEFVRLLEEIEPAILKKSAEQCVPPMLFRATLPCKSGFLKAYIDSECTVSAREREIVVASMSEKLLENVRSLLLSFGIESQLHPRNNGSHRLRISGRDFERYVDQIGFVTDRKALSAAEFDDVQGNTNTDVIPNVGETLRGIRETLAISQFDCGVPRTTYQHYERGDRHPSRSSLRTVLDAFERRVDRLSALREGITDGEWDAIIEARDELDISQAALADGMDVSQTAISYYERNETVPDGGRVMDAQGVVLERLDSALSATADIDRLRALIDGDIAWDRIESIDPVEPDYEWVYDLEVEGTHSYISNNVISHNSQLLQYVRNLAPRSVYTSGKGSSSAGLTAAAVRDDFGDGQQWTLEAGALVLADQGIAAVDELDKMRCVTGETRVRTADGRTRPIGELAAEAVDEGTIESLENGRTVRNIDLNVVTMADGNRLVERPVTAIHEYDAPSELIEVTLESGASVTATPDHPFFVSENDNRIERGAEDLDTGDTVLIPDSEGTLRADGGGGSGIHDVPSRPRSVTDCKVKRTRRVENDGRWSSIYDLTVEGTHNFVANGMIVHNSEDRSAMHEALEQQSYHPDTEILLADGRRVEVGEFVDDRMASSPEAVVDGVDCEILPIEDTRLHSTDLDTNETTKLPIDRVSRHEAPEKFVRVSFSNGREVTVTPEHPMFTEQDGDVGTVEAREIEAGAFVPAPRKLPNSSAAVELDAEPHVGKEKDLRLPTELSEDLAEILGFLVAEGHSYAGSSHEIGFSNRDERLLARMGKLVSSVFGIESTDTTNVAGTVTKRWISTKLYRWFEANFPGVMWTARDKRIPDRVLGASEEAIRRFLVGAFAGDGAVESEAMSFSTASTGLAEDYADALSKIGVGSRIHHTASEDAWKVYVMGDSTERFVDAVVDPADERHEDAVGFVERSNRTRRHHDVLPTSAARELRELKRLLGVGLTGKFKPHLDEGYGVQIETVREELETLRSRADEIEQELRDADDLRAVREAAGWSGRQLADRIDGETTSAVHYAESGGYDAESGGYDAAQRSNLTEFARRAVSDALDEFNSRAERLEDRCDLRYYRVTDVETIPNEGENACEWVYDVTVEPTNTFVSKGVVLHNSISISKAGINATLKSRCSLLGAANPKYGRFDQYEPIGEQIDLEPALISRFDLIFTVTDQPDAEKDADLAEHIINTNYAGELHTHRENTTTSNVSAEEVESVTESVEPEIDAELLRKYVAHAKRNCYPMMTEEAKDAIRDFYVDLRAKGQDEDAPVPVTARKLEALVRLAEASARMRLSDTVEHEDAERVIEIVRSCLQDIGVDPETGEFDADVVETGQSKTQRDRIKNIKALISEIEAEYDEGAPIDTILDRAEEMGMERSQAEHEIEKLRRQGDVYEPTTDHLRTV